MATVMTDPVTGLPKPQDPRAALATLLGVTPEEVGAGATSGPNSAPYTVAPTGDTDKYGFSGKTPTQGELSSPFEKAISAQATLADEKDRAHTASMQALSDFFLPAAEQKRAEEHKAEIEKAQAVPRATAEGNIAVEKLKAQSAENVARIKDEAIKLDANQQKQLGSIHSQYAIASDVLPLVRKLADAQDEFNASTWGKLPAMATQIPGIGGAMQSAWQNLLYKHGLAPEEVANATQRIGLAQASGMVAFAGRPTAQWINLLSQHMAVPGLPWREEERRLTGLVQGNEGGGALLPQQEQQIYDVARKKVLPGVQ